MADGGVLRVCCRARVGALLIDLDLTVSAGWTALFGPSGSGKSSLLRLIAGIWSPPRSTVHLHGVDLTRSPAYLRRVGLVAQQPALFPHLHVLGNILFGGDRQHADAMLDLFELQNLRQARVNTLSGGERQRVALARALAASPQLLLLDEVFTGMHMAQRDDLLQRVQRHCTERGVPVLSVTHDAVEASLIAGEVIKLEAGRATARGKAADVLVAEREILRRTLTSTSSLRSEVSE